MHAFKDPHPELEKINKVIKNWPRPLLVVLLEVVEQVDKRLLGDKRRALLDAARRRLL